MCASGESRGLPLLPNYLQDFQAGDDRPLFQTVSLILENNWIPGSKATPNRFFMNPWAHAKLRPFHGPTCSGST